MNVKLLSQGLAHAGSKGLKGACYKLYVSSRGAFRTFFDVESICSPYKQGTFEEITDTLKQHTRGDVAVFSSLPLRGDTQTHDAVTVKQFVDHLKCLHELAKDLRRTGPKWAH